MPGRFKPATPPGGDNPDWAVPVQHDGGGRLDFVVETNNSAFALHVHGKDKAKIECGKVHFSASGDGRNAAQLVVAIDLATLLANTE